MPKRRSIAEQTQITPDSTGTGGSKPKRQKPEPSFAAAKVAKQPAFIQYTCTSDVDEQAAAVVQRVLSAHSTGRRGVSVKALVLAPGVRASKAVYAVVCKTLEQVAALRSVAQQTGLNQHYPQLTEGTALVLLYEILAGEGVRRKGKAERLVLEHSEAARALWLKLKAGDVQNKASQAAWPRSVRVNTLRWTVVEAQAYLEHKVSVLTTQVLSFATCSALSRLLAGPLPGVQPSRQDSWHMAVS